MVSTGRLCSYTDSTEREGRINPPNIHLTPGPLPGLYCEWGDMEMKRIKYLRINLTKIVKERPVIRKLKDTEERN